MEAAMATETASGKLAAVDPEIPKPADTKRTFSPEYLAEQKAIMARVMEEGERRIHRSVDRLVAMGFYDKDGNRLKRDLPADMEPSADRDFGG
jgi:hypothetical protein